MMRQIHIQSMLCCNGQDTTLVIAHRSDLRPWHRVEYLLGSNHFVGSAKFLDVLLEVSKWLVSGLQPQYTPFTCFLAGGKAGLDI